MRSPPPDPVAEAYWQRCVSLGVEAPVRRRDRVRSRLTGWVGTVRDVDRRAPPAERERPYRSRDRFALVEWEGGMQTRIWLGDLEGPLPAKAVAGSGEPPPP